MWWFLLGLLAGQQQKETTPEDAELLGYGCIAVIGFIAWVALFISIVRYHMDQFNLIATVYLIVSAVLLTAFFVLRDAANNKNR